MQHKVNCWVKAYHLFRVYLPVTLIFGLISMIYITYICTYISYLVKPTENPSSYPFLHTTTPEVGRTKGIALITVVTFFLVMLLVSLLRVIIMDPGYFPNPLKLEYQILLRAIKSQSPIKKKFPKEKKYINSKAGYLQLNEDKPFQITNFGSAFHEIVSDMPLSAYETSAICQQIAKIDEKKTEIADMDTDSRVTVDDNSGDLPTDPFEKMSSLDFRMVTLCGSCLRWKVERSHHCRQCGKCVLKMDHHCPWLANCIGFRNYKYFLLVQFYGVLLTLLIFFSFLEALINYNLNFDSDMVLVIYIFFTWICDLGLMAFLTWLFVVNWSLVFRGETVIENSDKERFPSTKGHNIYNLGCWKNFKSVFGWNPLIWFIPFFANQEGGGYIFENNLPKK